MKFELALLGDSLSFIPEEVKLLMVYLAVVLLALIASRMLLRLIRKIAVRANAEKSGLLIKGLKLPMIIFSMAFGALIVAECPTGIDLGDYAALIMKIGKTAAIVATAIFIDRLARGLVLMHSEKVDLFRTSRGVVNNLLSIIIYATGFMMILDQLGVSITPVLASMGIGSLAVALALQPALENFFSGMQIISDKTIAKGHYIKLEGGEEGYVEKIGWRSTSIRQLAHNIVIVPNKQLVNAKIINYYYPTTELGVQVDVGVHYDTDLERAEAIVLEVAGDVMRNVAGGVPASQPSVRYVKFADSGIEMKVNLRIAEYDFIAPVRHHFIKRLHKRFRQEGIVIPYPIRTVQLSQETVSSLARRD